MEFTREQFVVSDDKSRICPMKTHELLANTYWAKGRPLEIVKETIENSFCFGLYEGQDQIGFARAVTDFATIAFLSDVCIHEQFRNRGFGHFFMKCIFEHPKLQKVGWILRTAQSQSLYSDFQFQEVDCHATETTWMYRRREQLPLNVD